MRFLTDCRIACRRNHIRPTQHLLVACVARQQLLWLVRSPLAHPLAPDAYRLHRRFTASTSRFGIGQVRDTQRTPLGLHRIGAKIGRGWPVGTAFRARVPIGFTWNGLPEATIAHRILWLDGLEPGFNQGGEVDTRSRFIYIHGLADEPTLGRPASHGCIHLAAHHLLPLFDQIPLHSLVWITAQS
jgi:hypothetical protein